MSSARAARRAEQRGQRRVPAAPTGLDEPGLLARARLAIDTGQAHAAVALLEPHADAGSPVLRRVLGEALRRAGRSGDAAALLFNALGKAPTDVGTYVQLGIALKDLGMLDGAVEAYRNATVLEPHSVMSQGYLLHASQQMANWTHYEADLAALHAALAARETQSGDDFGLPFALVGLPHTLAQMRQAASMASRYLTRSIRPLPARRPVARERLRIAYLSADFHAHATAALAVELLEQHDRTRFEVFLYSHGPDDRSALRQRVCAAAEHFVEVGGLSHPALAARLRDDGIDILVDLKGHTAGSRVSVLAYRPAPVQVTWLGFPGTSGADFIDYLIGDPIVTPLADAAGYSERIAQLPGCYQPQDSKRPVGAAPSREQLGLRADALVLVSANATYKITPPLWAAWMAVLQRLPAAQLWLVADQEGAAKRLREAAERAGVDPQRLVFAPKVGMEAHWARLAVADLALDTWPCTGHTTTSDLLSVGVPVLTLQGDNFASRVAASILHTAGLPELVADSPADYVERACRLGSDAAKRQRLRAHLLARPAALYDTPRFARELEALYERMWERALAGQPPAALPALTPACS